MKKLDYQFTTPEAAFIIYHSAKATLEEKFSALQWIIDNMPDCSMEERGNTETIPSFQKFLTDYINLKQHTIEHFYATSIDHKFSWEVREFVSKIGL